MEQIFKEFEDSNDFVRLNIKTEPEESLDLDSDRELQYPELYVKTEIKEEQTFRDEITYQTALAQGHEQYLVNTDHILIKECSVKLVPLCDTQTRKYFRKLGILHLYKRNQEHNVSYYPVTKCRCELCKIGRIKKTQSSTKQYTCDKCGKMFVQRCSLRRHFDATHSLDRPFQCQICEKAFARKEYLQFHLVTHGDVKPFKCQKCDRTFGRKEYLRTHLLSHSGVKSYKCEICEQSFVRKCNLKVHLQSQHSGVRSYRCDVCDKPFARKDNLQLHIWTHTNRRPYKCHICDKMFARQHILDTHLKMHEKKKLRCNTEEVLEPQFVKLEPNS